MQPFDARSVANLILDIADQERRNVSNLVLQKLIYFVHGRYLNWTGRPLVSGTFEAWQYGPVHPHVYNAFKKCGDDAIKTRAVALDPITAQSRPLPSVDAPQVIEFVKDTFRDLMKRSASNLVDMSHAKDGPWGFIIERVKTRKSVSVRIPNEIIAERFKFHKLSVDAMKEREVPSENSPFG